MMPYRDDFLHHAMIRLIDGMVGNSVSMTL
jgi:hypothetical protein